MSSLQVVIAAGATVPGYYKAVYLCCQRPCKAATVCKGVGGYLLYLRSCAFKYRYILYSVRHSRPEHDAVTNLAAHVNMTQNTQPFTIHMLRTYQINILARMAVNRLIAGDIRPPDLHYAMMA
jgi:hypothetical protein